MKSKERFVEIILDGVFPVGYRLVTDTRIRSLILMKEHMIHDQVCFTPKEYSIMLHLCEAFPRGCRYEKLLAVIKDIEESEALKLLRDALSVGGSDGYDRELKCLRTLISRLRAPAIQLSVSIESDTKKSMYILAKPGRRMSLQERLLGEIADEEAS